ncbi:hypothetical protein LCGC14_0145130 [marine sediment metagenome]|uniref:Uncharacterized protein n=1 Tax=marine sediment metagenome TaxID=412755 RepID=A0A0F9XH79_9ZZZZ
MRLDGPSKKLAETLQKEAQDNQKVSQTTAGYNDSGEINKCSTCKTFKAPNSCTVVSGIISPEGTSDLYSPKTE